MLGFGLYVSYLYFVYDIIIIIIIKQYYLYVMLQSNIANIECISYKNHNKDSQCHRKTVGPPPTPLPHYMVLNV